MKEKNKYTRRNEFMKRTLKTKITKRIASILSATIILTSGGYTIVANMFGIRKNNNKILISEENNNTKTISSIETMNENKSSQENKYRYKYIEPEYKYLIDTPKTMEAISQEENINRLIRKRKKETQEKINV